MRWSAGTRWFRASRETAELQAESLQMGTSLRKLLTDLDLLPPFALAAAHRCEPLTLPAAFALAAHSLAIPAHAAITAYLWSWLENQVLAAMKTVPLGQVAGQKLLLELGAIIPDVVAAARELDDDAIASFAPGFVLASVRHETQYTRLFRS